MFGQTTQKYFLVEYHDGEDWAVDTVVADYAQAYGDGVKFVTKGQLVGYYPHIKSMNEWDSLLDDADDVPGEGFDGPVLCDPDNNCCCGTRTDRLVAELEQCTEETPCRLCRGGAAVRR
jgi:hypothetical protein